MTPSKCPLSHPLSARLWGRFVGSKGELDRHGPCPPRGDTYMAVPLAPKHTRAFVKQNQRRPLLRATPSTGNTERNLLQEFWGNAWEGSSPRVLARHHLSQFGGIGQSGVWVEAGPALRDWSTGGPPLAHELEPPPANQTRGGAPRWGGSPELFEQ